MTQITIKPNRVTVVTNARSIATEDAIAEHNADTNAHGGAFTSPRIKVPFSWGDATPALIFTLSGTVFLASIVIQTPFNGTGAALSLGDDANPQRLIATSEVDPRAQAFYTNSPAHTYPVSTQIKLYITPGAGASQGSGYVVLEV